MFYSKNNSLTYEPVKIESNCDICGKHEMLLSSINLFATFGSKNDLESRTVYACGDCSVIIGGCYAPLPFDFTRAFAIFRT